VYPLVSQNGVVVGGTLELPEAMIMPAMRERKEKDWWFLGTIWFNKQDSARADDFKFLGGL